MGFGNMLPSGFMKLEVTGRCTIPKHDYIQRRLSFNQKIHTKATRYTSDTKNRQQNYSHKSASTYNSALCLKSGR